MREDVRDWILLIGKSILFVIGGITATASVVELIVGGFSWLAVGYLAFGLALAVPPVVLAFRDAYVAAREGRMPRGGD